MRNTFGHLFTLTTFGESHGEAIGGVVDGMPAGIAVDPDFLQHELDRRRPGQSALSTERREEDRVRLLSGVFEGRTTGAPIGFVVENHDARPQDYDELRDKFRPSHADYTHFLKYGERDHRGGGRSSARITLSRCVAGALAKLALHELDVTVQAYTSQVGDIALDADYSRYDLSLAEQNPVRCPDQQVAEAMCALIKDVKAAGDSVGGVVTCVIRNCPAGLGEPEFDKLQARLAAAMLSINAAKGFDYGDGFAAATARGSRHNDQMTATDGRVRLLSNHSGGIQGGVSNGEDIFFRVAFKPVATLRLAQQTVDRDFRPSVLEARGRHDACVVPRAVPIVEAMAAMVVMDAFLLNKTVRM